MDCRKKESSWTKCVRCFEGTIIHKLNVQVDWELEVSAVILSGVWGARLERKTLGRFLLQTSAVFGSEDDWKGCSRLLDQARGSSGNVIGTQICVIEVVVKKKRFPAEQRKR